MSQGLSETSLPAGVLFNAADRRSLEKLTDSDFDKTLVLALLFEPQLVIPDVFFFNSPLVLAHLKRSGARSSLLELALAERIIVPRVRSPRMTTFDQMRRELESDGIFGLLRASDRRYVSERLAHLRGAEDWEQWPDRMAESYASLLVGVLRQESPPRVGSLAIGERVWSRTASLRSEALDIALGREKNYGVRRAEVIRAVAEIEGILPPDARYLPDEDALLHEVRDAERAREVRSFFTWLDALYARNQAGRFGLRTSVKTSDHDVLVMLSVDTVESPRGDRRSVSEPIRELAVRMPNLNTLVRQPPSVILGLRQLGLAWRLALEDYLQFPHRSAASAMELRLEEFGAAARDEVRGGMLRNFGFGGAVGAGAAGLFGAVTDAVSAVDGGLLFSATAFGAATVRTLQQSRTQKIDYPLRMLTTPENSH